MILAVDVLGAEETPPHPDGSIGEVATHIDPDSCEQHMSSQVPTTRLGFLSFEPRPQTNEPLFDPTTAQRIRHQQLIDKAERNGQRDYYNTELGILELEEDDIILSVENREDILIELVLDSGMLPRNGSGRCAWLQGP